MALCGSPRRGSKDLGAESPARVTAPQTPKQWRQWQWQSEGHTKHHCSLLPGLSHRIPRRAGGKERPGPAMASHTADAGRHQGTTRAAERVNLEALEQRNTATTAAAAREVPRRESIISVSSKHLSCDTLYPIS